MINYDEVSNQIEEAILRKEVNIRDGHWGVARDCRNIYQLLDSESPCCCPLGAVILGICGRLGPNLSAAKELRVSELFTEGFTSGFDGYVMSEAQKEYWTSKNENNYILGYQMGHEFRDKYILRKTIEND